MFKSLIISFFLSGSVASAAPSICHHGLVLAGDYTVVLFGNMYQAMIIQNAQMIAQGMECKTQPNSTAVVCTTFSNIDKAYQVQLTVVNGEPTSAAVYNVGDGSGPQVLAPDLPRVVAKQ